MNSIRGSSAPLIIVAVIILLFRILVSAMNADSAIFYYIGSSLEYGRMPYKDIWDHKGPLLYLINYFFSNLLGYYGVLVFEIIALFVAIYFVYRRADFFKSSFSIPFLALFSLSYYHFSEFGNYSETWSIPFQFIVYSILYDKAVLKRDIKDSWAFLAGVLFALILLMRPNNAVGVFFAMLLTFRGGSQYIKLFIGTSVVVLLTFFWLASNNALSDFFDQYLLYNYAYVTEKGSLTDALILPFEQFLKSPLTQVVLFLIALRLVFSSEEKLLDKPAFFFVSVFIADLFGSHLSLRPYLHYNVTYLPSLFFLGMLFARRLEQVFSKVGVSTMALSVFAVSLPAVAYTSWVVIRDSVKSYKEISYFNESSATRILSNEVLRHLKEENINDLYIYGFGARYYNYLGIVSKYKYIYSYPFYSSPHPVNLGAHKFVSSMLHGERYVLQVTKSSCNDDSSVYSYDQKMCELLNADFEPIYNSGSQVDMYTNNEIVLWKRIGGI